MKRYDIINTLIYHFGYKSYLEIGTQFGEAFEAINLEDKHCVDTEKVYAKLTHNMTSDEFFKQCTRKYDIIFIDGLHTEEQTTTDIENAFKVLNENGTIVCHDSLPPSEEFTAMHWCGTSFRAIVNQRRNPNIEIQVVDTDCGCGILRRGSQKTCNESVIALMKDWNNYNSHKKELVNVISIDEFVQQFGRGKYGE